MANEYVELWSKKHGKRYCNYVLSRMDVTQLDELEGLARNIVFNGKTIKNIKLKQEHLSLSVFAFFTGIIMSFSSLFMPIFFKNASVAASSIGAMTVFTSSLINRRTLHEIKELEIYTHSKRNELLSSIEDHEVDDVKNELIRLIRSYAYYAPYACSTYIKHWHTKKLSKLMKQTDDSSVSTSDDEEDIEILASEIFFKYKCSQGVKIHKRGSNLSLKEFIAGLSLICLSLLCDKWYNGSVVPDLRESYVPSIVGFIGAFITFYSTLWYFYDEISVRIFKKSQLGHTEYELFSSILEKEAVGPISSEIQVLSTIKTMRKEAHCSRTRHKEVFHIT